MLFTSFLDKVNLPKFCELNGIEGCRFVRIPNTGWVGINDTEVFNLFDLFEPHERIGVFKYITKDKQDLLDFDILYSPTTETKLNNSFLEYSLWDGVYRKSKSRANEESVVWKGEKIQFTDLLAENGYSALLDNNIGLFTHDLYEEIDKSPYTDVDMAPPRNRILIPTFSTPCHISSVTISNWSDLDRKYTPYKNKSEGWCGNIDHPHIVGYPSDLAKTRGITYHENIRHFTDKASLSDLPCSVLMDLYKHVDIEFDIDPIDKIVETNQSDRIRYYLKHLDKDDILYIENRTGLALLESWKSLRSLQMEIGSTTYERTVNNVYQLKGRARHEVCNFFIQLNEIKTIEGKKVFTGLVYFEELVLKIELDSKYLNSGFLFCKKMREFFLNAGIGICLISPTFEQRIHDIFLRFNQSTISFS